MHARINVTLYSRMDYDKKEMGLLLDDKDRNLRTGQAKP